MTHKILLRGLGVHITYQRSTVTYTALILFYLNLPKCHCGLTFCAWDEDSALSGLKLTTSLHIYFSVLLLLALSFFFQLSPFVLAILSFPSLVFTGLSPDNTFSFDFFSYACVSRAGQPASETMESRGLAP